MPRYKIRMPEQGEVLTSSDGEYFAVAESDILAREVLNEYLCWDDREPIVFIRPCVASFHYVTKRQIEAEDFPFFDDEPHPGDNYWEIRSGEPGGKYEVRVWAVGPPTLVRWQIRPSEVAPAPHIETVPVGQPCHHPRHGSLVTTSRAFKVAGVWCFKAKGWQDRTGQSVRSYVWRTLSIQRSMSWPPDIRDLVIDGEVVATGSEEAMRTLLDIREARLRSEWEAEQFAALVA